jgi:N-acetylneuraminic acid mutarotase
MVLSVLLSHTITWTTKTPLPQVRSAAGCGVVNDSVYVIGGSSGGTSLHNTNYVYDPITDSWATKTPMPTPRSQLGCAVVRDKIYAIGGFVGGIQTDTNLVEVYDPVTDSWVTKTPMPTSRYAFAIAVVANKIYVMGGMLPVVATVEEYDPSADTVGGTPWKTKTSMPTRRMGPACAVIRDTIYVYGGSYSVGMKDTLVNECYDPATDSWTARADMDFNRYGCGGFSYNNEAYSVGGYNYSSYFTNVDVYDPVGNSWSSETPMNYARQSIAIGLVGSKVYVIGGWNNGPLAYNEEGSFPTAIEDLTIDAFAQDYRVTVRWTASYPYTVFQYTIMRSGTEDGEYIEIARIPGSDYSPLHKTYSYCDETVVGGERYYYKLGVTTEDGKTTWYGPVSVVVNGVRSLLSVSPNPFSTATTISFQGISDYQNTSIPELQIFDVTGRVVRHFFLYPSSFIFPVELEWDGRDDKGEKASPGIYFISLEVNGSLFTEKVTILR